MFSSGSNISRGNATSPLDMPPLTECLHLEPVTLGSQKYTRSGELRRVLGFGSASEDHSFGVVHPKPPPVATEELKLFKESVQDASRKARDRSKMFKDSIIKLDKYNQVLTSKKRQRSEFSVTERSNGSNLPKMGSQIHRSPHEGMPQRLEDRPKSVGLNKRVRTSVADVRPDGKRSPSPRQQLAMEKAGDSLPDVGGGGVRFEEKIRRLPAGGEGWDTKNKKKRSVGMVSGRVLNGERDLKRSLLPKMNSDSKLRSCDAQDFRSKSSPGVSGINKSDCSLEPTSSDTSTALRNEMDSGPPPRDRMALLEKKVLTKASNKPNVHEENLASSPSTMIKAKVSRAPRTGSIMQLDSSLKTHPSSTSLQGSEQASSSNKVPVPGVANNPKRQMSAGSSSHAMAQWVGQRPHKNSRTRRANIITPVSNNGEAQISSPGFLPSEFSGRISSIATNGSLVASSLDNGTPKIKREIENAPSPFGFSESEESGAGENKVKDKGRDSCETTPTASLKPGSFVIPSKKNKLPTNEVGEGVRRQGRTGRSPSLTRPGVNSGREKLENQPTMKPIPIVKPPDKNKSKSGRPPSKKLKDRKARVGPVSNGNSSDYTGESDDDREELFAAANSARNACNLALSGPFWKQMEPIFASVSSEDTSYLKQQLSFAEELDESFAQMLGVEYNVLGVLMHKESPNCTGEKLANGPTEKSANSTSLRGKVDIERLEKGAPLYQRVLSAIIEEDECEEFYVHGEGKNVPHYASDDSHCGSCNLIDMEPRDRDRTESEVESVNFQNQRSYFLDGFSCNKSVASNSIRNPSMSSPLQSNGQWRGDDEVSHSDLVHGSEISSNDMGLRQTRELTTPGFSSSDRQYQLMCLDDKLLLELQSIGICPEKLPDLTEGEEVINQDIVELKEGLYEQIGEKRRKLEKIDRATVRDKDVGKRSIEQTALDQLVEIAYRKRLSLQTCRGNSTSKGGVRKVPRQVALGFIRRTLGRCKKFENGGISCFSEPALQDALFSTPPCTNDAKSADCVGSGTASNTPNDVPNHQGEARLSGGVASSPLERYDSHCDSFERGKKKDVLIDDVIISASSALDHGTVSGNKGGNRKVKAKPTKQKSAAAAAAANGPRGSSHPTGAPNGRSKPEREVKPKEAEEEAMDLPMDELDKLGVSTDDGNQDLGSIFNLLDDDGLQDHYSIGLEIPMDDLSELNLM